MNLVNGTWLNISNKGNDMTQPFYRLHHRICVVDVFLEDKGSVRIPLDPRRTYPVDILQSMPNGTMKITIYNMNNLSDLGDSITCFLMNARGLEIGNFGALFDGRYNNGTTHLYVTKKDVRKLQFFNDVESNNVGGSGIWQDTFVNCAKVQIMDRTDGAVKIAIGDKTGWTKQYSDIELTNFEQLFNGQFNQQSAHPIPVEEKAVAVID